MKHEESKVYFPGLSGIRVFCAIAVVLHHTLYYFDKNNPLHILSLGNSSVTLFFVLSGFVAYCSCINKKLDIYNYYKSRFLRIYPMYLFILICFFLFVGKNQFWMSKPSNSEVFFAIVGLQSFIPYPRYFFAINPVGWFVSTIMFLYILFPIFYKYIKENKCIKVLLFSIFLYIVMILMCISCIGLNESNSFFVYENRISTNYFLYFNPFSRIFQFVIGMILAKIIHSPNWSKIKRCKIFSINSLIFIFFLYILYYNQFQFLYIEHEFTTIKNIVNLTSVSVFTTFASLVIIISLTNDYWKCDVYNIFSSNIVNLLGKISYSIFLFHPLLSSVLFRINYYNMLNVQKKIFLYFALLFIFSYFLHYIFECKFPQLISKIKEKTHDVQYF